MTIAETDDPALMGNREPYFNAILHPYRSMGSKGFFWLMAFIGTIMLLVSVYFFFLGAWPIIGFAGLDVLLIYWAFRCNYRDARASEQILITSQAVEVIRTSPTGRRERFDFNPYWVRVESLYEEDRGMTGLALTSHGKQVEIGAFLHACERESFAKALKSALADAKAAGAQVSGG